MPLLSAAAGCALALSALAVVACTARADAPPQVTVFAASSLTEAFEDLADEFERRHPEVDVVLTFAGSQVLRLQIEQGAAADVFASANAHHMQELVDGGYVQSSRIFAVNELVIITPLDNPGGILSLANLSASDRLVLAAENVPVGAYTREALGRADAVYGPDFAAGVMARVVSEEANVRLVRAKIELGEADAAIVYRTDAVASERVATIDIPASVNVRAEYPIGVVSDSRQAQLAAALVEFVASDAGRKILARHGFVDR